ncbi:MAG: hypothetical protein ACR2JB_25950 [Bryobacteraceae bacterium]
MNNSTVVAADILSLLSKIAQGVGALAGVPVAPGMASLLSTLFTAVANQGGAPNLSLAVDQVQGKVATSYSDALNANNTTHEALVTNWSQLSAFAAAKVGTVPTDDDLEQMRSAGEVPYAIWLIQTISPAAWSVVIPQPEVLQPEICDNPVPENYPVGSSSSITTYPVGNNSGCGNAWFGSSCGFFGCSTPAGSAFEFLFGGDCEVGGPPCPDPVNGPFGLNPTDAFLGQNGWNLPCFGSDCPLSAGVALAPGRTHNARAAIQSLLALLRSTVTDQAMQTRLAEPLMASLAALKTGGSTERDFALHALQNFVFEAEAPAHRDFDAKTLIAAAEKIRGQLTDDASPAVVYTRHTM